METLDQNYLQLDRADVETRASFIRKTYTHVAIAVLAFIGVEAVFLSIPGIDKFAIMMTNGWMWLVMLGAFMFVTNYAEKMAAESHEQNRQYLGLGLYIIAEAFIFIPLLYYATQLTNSPTLISQAAILTLGLFAGLSAIVFITGKDFSFLRSGLTIGFFIAMGLIVAGIAFGFNLGLWFSVALVLLAAGSILYQTSNLIHKYSTDQYVAAALGLFASLMLLFWYILQIMSSRK
jgi:FtsH-binding integral membrane protein